MELKIEHALFCPFEGKTNPGTDEYETSLTGNENFDEYGYDSDEWLLKGSLQMTECSFCRVITPTLPPAPLQSYSRS
jgi:hypothetical protein